MNGSLTVSATSPPPPENAPTAKSETTAVRRFTCPNDPTHTQFYARHLESFAHDVDAYGNVDENENKNSMESDGYDIVHCDECPNNPVAIDAREGEELNEVGRLPDICEHDQIHRPKLHTCEDGKDCFNCTCCHNCREDVDDDDLCPDCGGKTDQTLPVVSAATA
jgi:hypothetical protein